jgi:hypothetical protein
MSFAHTRWTTAPYRLLRNERGRTCASKKKEYAMTRNTEWRRRDRATDDSMWPQERSAPAPHAVRMSEAAALHTNSLKSGGPSPRAAPRAYGDIEQPSVSVDVQRILVSDPRAKRSTHVDSCLGSTTSPKNRTRWSGVQLSTERASVRDAG